MSLMNKLSTLAKSQQGKDLLAKAKTIANDPKTREKIDDARDKFSGHVETAKQKMAEKKAKDDAATPQYGETGAPASDTPQYGETGAPPTQPAAGGQGTPAGADGAPSGEPTYGETGAPASDKPKYGEEDGPAAA